MNPPSSHQGGTDTTAAANETLNQFFEDTRAYLESEMAMQEEEWNYLLACNQLLLFKYRELNMKAANVGAVLDDAQRHLLQLPEHFSKLDQLERNIEILEAVMKGLDQYSRVLEDRFAPTK
jgi:hypothetical protein